MQSPRSPRSVALKAWAIIGVCVVFVLIIKGLSYVWPAVELLLAGGIMGFICSPITNWLETKKVPRSLAAFIALLVMLAVLVGILVLLTPAFISQLIEVLQRVPSYVKTVQTGLNDLWAKYGTSESFEVKQTLDQVVSMISTWGSAAASSLSQRLSGGVIDSAVGAINGFFTFFLGLVLAYWFAKDYPKIARELRVIAGPNRAGDLSVLLAVMSRSMGGYMRGIVITSTVGGFLSFIGFVIIGHPYAPLMGIVVGLFHFVPVIGPWLAAGMAMILALFVSPLLALESLLVSVVAQNVTDNVVSPLVMQSAVKVHPVLSLVGIIIGNSLGGILGMALAIPLTAAIRSVFVYYFESKSGRQLVSEAGALFKSHPYVDNKGKPCAAFDALDDDKFFESTLLVTEDEARSLLPSLAHRQDQPKDEQRASALKKVGAGDTLDDVDTGDMLDDVDAGDTSDNVGAHKANTLK